MQSDRFIASYMNSNNLNLPLYLRLKHFCKVSYLYTRSKQCLTIIIKAKIILMPKNMYYVKHLYHRHTDIDRQHAPFMKIVYGKMLLVRIIENNKIDTYFRTG